MTVQQTIKGWFVSIQTEMDVNQPVHPSKSAIGVDLGIVNLATLSDETMFLSLKNQLAKYEQKLKQAQRALARKKEVFQQLAKAKSLDCQNSQQNCSMSP